MDPERKEDIFCMIASGKIGSAKVWEDDEFIAILDINPNTEGMTLVMPKRHYGSDAFDMDDAAYARLMMASKKVAKMLEKGLDVKRVAMVMEGMGIDHVHVKLYPLHGLSRKFEEKWSTEIKTYPKYEGFISTHLGPKANMDELKKLAGRILERQ